MMPAGIDFEYLFEHSPNAYMLLTRELNFVAVNAAYLQVTGRCREELIGQNLFEAFPADPHVASDEAIRRLQESIERTFISGQRDTLALIHYPLPRQTTDGMVFEDRYWSATHTPVFDSNGKVLYVMQHTVDITELQTLKQALDEAEAARDALLPREQLEAGVFSRAQMVQDVNRSLYAERQHLLQLFQQAPGFICFLRGPEHIFELASDAYYQLVGHRDLLGLRVREALPEVEGQGFISLLDGVYRAGEPHVGRDVRVLLQRQPNEPLAEVFVNFVYQPVFDRNGSVTGIFVQGNDVTDQHLAQEELDRYRAQLEDLVLERTQALNESQAALRHAQKMEAVGRLTGGVAHDFNNLLQIIGGNLQLLQRSLAKDASTQRRLTAALDSVERGAKLASQLLAFARRQPLTPNVVNLGGLLQGMDELLQRALGEDVVLQTEIEPELWNTFVDAGQMENALLNLAINARDAMASGGRFVIQAENTSLTSADQAQALDLTAGEYIHLTVSDTGSGIPPEVVEQVFEPFFTTKPEGQGTGLGLSMVYGFVKQSGGQIKLTSRLGQGTSIDIWLPRATQQEERDLAQLPGAVEGGNETILVVEDDDEVRRTAVDMLRELGYTVLEAHDGSSALGVLQQHGHVDLLFTDVIMPGAIASVELVRQAKNMLPGLQVLFTSGYTDDVLVHNGRLDPGVVLLSKPFRHEDLARRVRHMLNNAQQAALAQEALSAPQVAEPTPASQAKSALCILLVEDEELIREALRDILEESGYDIQAAASAEEAEELLSASSFDVLFTDVSLPGKSGIELAGLARARYPQLRIILSSGYSANAPAMRSADFTDAIFLPKPYDIDEVERVMAKLAASNQLAR